MEKKMIRKIKIYNRFSKMVIKREVAIRAIKISMINPLILGGAIIAMMPESLLTTQAYNGDKVVMKDDKNDLLAIKEKEIFIDELSKFYEIDKKEISLIVDEVINEEINDQNDFNEKIDDSVVFVEPEILVKNKIEDELLNNTYNLDNTKYKFGTSGQARIEEVKNSEIGALYEKYGKEYGVDPVLLMARDMQESGLKHESFDPNGAYGISQIEHTLFGSHVSAFNYEKNKYEEETITESGALNINTNIKYGAMKMQNMLRNYNYNFFIAIQAYNYGSGSMDIVLKNYATQVNKTIDEVKNDKNNTNWEEVSRDFSNNPNKYINWGNGSYGDPNYVYNVTRYIYSNDIKIKDENGNYIIYNLYPKELNVDINALDNYIDMKKENKKVLIKK